MSAPPDQRAEPPARAVTPASRRRPGTAAAERKRQQRQREREQKLIYETEDWRLFTDLATLPQKAGCQPEDLRKVVLKELVDNALDTGAAVSLEHADGAWIIADDGPGLEPAEVPRLFAVDRPLLSSKLVRLPLRGMLGNGLRVVAGAVAANEGCLVIETRGRRLTLAVCQGDGPHGRRLRRAGPAAAGGDGPPLARPLATPPTARWRAPPSPPPAAGRATPAPPRPGGTAARTCTGYSRRSRRPTPRSARCAAASAASSSTISRPARGLDGTRPRLSWHACAPAPSRCRRNAWASSGRSTGRVGPATRARPAPRPRRPARAYRTSWRLGPSARARRRRGKGRWGSACS